MTHFVRNTPAHIAGDPSKRVIRVCTFPVPTFDMLKDFQREQEAKTGEQLTNSQALTLIITEHARLTAQEGK